MLKREKITIKDIAKEAGVSKSTVSRAINDNPGIDINTKEKILEIISKYNFVPSKSARELRGKKIQTVGILVTRLHSNSETQAMRGLMNVLYKNDVEYVIFETDFSIKKTKRFYETLLEKQINHLIIFAIANEKYDFIKEKDKVVIIGQNINTFDSITYEDYESIAKITNYLWDSKNRKKIGYIGLDVNDTTSGYERYKAYKDFVETKKIEEISYFGDFKYSSAYELAKKLVDKNVDSIICATDNIALGVKKYLYENNRNDILVTGVGNNELLNFMYKDHITIDFLYKESGEFAGELIMEKLNNQDKLKNNETLNNKKFKSRLVVSGIILEK